MPLVETHKLTPDLINQFSSETRLQTYNALDCCVTLEVFNELQRTHNAFPQIYDFERAIQAPYLEMMLRGFLINQEMRLQAAQSLRARIELINSRLQKMAFAIWDKPLNPASPKQLQSFFYGAMRLPEVWLNQKGVRKLSTNREALEKLEIYLYARPIISAILAIRDLSKQLQIFETEIDPDSRFRTSYNIAGTETGRPSSSENAFGTGGNAQNIAPNLRYVFVADPHHKLVNIDLEQVEARDVGFICGCLFDDWTFLNSCESGDLHTNNARLIWPELPWTDDPKSNRQIADRQFYREFSYRDMAKRGSHLSNYYGTAYTAARHLKVPQPIMEEFQARYCRGRPANPKRNLPTITPAYPCIPRYWQWVSTELQSNHQLTNLFGRRRHFFGRPNEDTTLREAIAFLPQSTTADRMNLGLWRVWKHLPDVQLLAQTYDSITFQVREHLLDEVVAQALALIQVPILAPGSSGRVYTVPGSATIGWNWGYRQQAKDGTIINPDGLIKWSPTTPDTRQRSQH